MKAFLTPLQGLAEFEQIKEKSKTNKGILQVSGLFAHLSVKIAVKDSHYSSQSHSQNQCTYKHYRFKDFFCHFSSLPLFI